jgi:hypothetical protein
MFFGGDCARDLQSIAKLFAGFFQSVYVWDDWIPNSGLPTPEDSHKISTIEISKKRSSALFWAWTSTKDPARTELHQLF